jgi:hypothetical protein
MPIVELPPVAPKDLAMSSNQTPPSDTQPKILDFSKFKQKQETNSEFSRARKPLYLNSNNGKVSGTEDGAKSASSQDDFGDRLVKIRTSLDRINSLMADLKKLSTHREKEKEAAKTH